ncbi:hypothetical protein ES702_07200 [subsurface metagenome]
MKRAPMHLKKSTRQWVNGILKDYEFETHHIRLLILAGEALDRCNTARDVLNEHGPTYLNRFGEPRARPEVVIERDSRLQFVRIVRELNLDADVPDSRPPGLKF